MNSPALSRTGESAPSPSDSVSNGHAKAEKNGPVLANGVSHTENGQDKGNGLLSESSEAGGSKPALKNGHTGENGHAKRNGTQLKQPKRRMTRIKSSSWVPPLAAKPADEPRPALAVFCWEHPEALVGQSVIQTVAALARRGTTVHLFGRFPPQFSSPPCTIILSATSKARICCACKNLPAAPPTLFCTSSPAAARTSRSWIRIGPAPVLSASSAALKTTAPSSRFVRWSGSAAT